MKPVQLRRDLFLFRDTCNVYVVRDGEEAIAIDFGSGRWLDALPRFGVRRLRHVFLTHHHVDQCAGLLDKKTWPFAIHAPAGEEKFLSPRGVRDFHAKPRHAAGCPASYSVLPRGIEKIAYDM